MGGRKSYSSKNLLKGSKDAKKAFTTLKDSIENSKTKEIGVNALKVFTSSKQTLDYTAYATKLTPSLIENYSKWKEDKDENRVRREISKSWAEVKQKYNISTPKQVDRIVVENALKSVKGDGNE